MIPAKQNTLEKTQHTACGKTGVLVVNLGTPDSTSTADVRKYLREFLMDGRVIDIPFLNRWLLVNFIIAPFRAPKSAEIYRKVWTPEGSPLKVYGYNVVDRLQLLLGDRYAVKLAMRYQNPSIPQALEEFRKAQLSSLIVVPLFPQYASATTGSVNEEVMRRMLDWQVIPEIRFLNKFYEHPGFIEGFARLGRRYMEALDYEHFVFSYHGLPERQVRKAYPGGHDCEKSHCRSTYHEANAHCYLAQCFHTTRLLAEALDIPAEKTTTCFQSRLGKTPWIQPYTEDVVEELPARGITRVLAFSPAFVADCLETTIEVGEEYRDAFIARGGNTWQLVESLNDSEHWIGTLADLVRRQS